MDAGLVAVFMEHRPALLRFLRARGASSTAEDLIQELWLKVAAGGTEPIADPLAYLYRAANNLLLDQRRSELRRNRREESWTYSAGRAAGEASDLDSGERTAIAREQLRVIEAALSSLGQPTEGIFRRFRVDGIAQAQIAAEMGISLSSVEKHLQKAYRLLLQLRRQSDAG
jgi:RNA polymerase sigma factor (sigma-70 family)